MSRRKPKARRTVPEPLPKTTLRKIAVKEGRAMVRVRNIESRDLATIGVCPACWSILERRRVLLVQLSKMGYEVVHRDDLLEGVYRPGKAHAPGCRYARIASDPWERFRSALGKH